MTRRHQPLAGTRHGSLLFEMVIALGIFAGSAITISGVVVRAAQTVESGRTQIEADDLARSALTLIQVGVISPEAADQLSEHEVRGLVAADPMSVGMDTDTAPRFELTIETQPTDWRTLTLVSVSVAEPDSDRVLARTRGLVNLGRIRSGAMRESGP
ncbi:MAG: hypothetical protein ACI89L_000200 [Phycisphaerales bacterium]|jgi:hypothetical protein